MLLAYIGLLALGDTGVIVDNFAVTVIFRLPMLLLSVTIPLAAADMLFRALGYAADLRRHDAGLMPPVILWFLAAILLFLYWLYIAGGLIYLIVTAAILLLRIVLRQI